MFIYPYENNLPLGKTEVSNHTSVTLAFQSQLSFNNIKPTQSTPLLCNLLSRDCLRYMILVPVPQDNSSTSFSTPFFPCSTKHIESIRRTLLTDGLVPISCSWSDLCLRYICMFHMIRLAYFWTLRAYCYVQKALKQTSTACGWAGYKLLLCTSSSATVTIILKNLVCLFVKSPEPVFHN